MHVAGYPVDGCYQMQLGCRRKHDTMEMPSIGYSLAPASDDGVTHIPYLYTAPVRFHCEADTVRSARSFFDGRNLVRGQADTTRSAHHCLAHPPFSPGVNPENADIEPFECGVMIESRTCQKYTANIQRHYIQISTLYQPSGGVSPFPKQAKKLPKKPSRPNEKRCLYPGS